MGHFSGSRNRPYRYGFMYLCGNGGLRFFAGHILVTEKERKDRSQVDESDKRYDNWFGYETLQLHFQGTLVINTQITPK